MPQLLHESPILRVTLTDEGWLYSDWHRADGLADVQTGCEVILECVQQTSCRKVLNDNRQVYTFWADAAEWVGRMYLPRLAAAGVRQLAWINALSIYGRLSTSQAVAYLEHIARPRTQLFDDYDEAADWLRAAD